MKKKILVLAMAGMLSAPVLFAQKQTTQVQQVWGAYMNQTRFSDRWGMWADFHLRSQENFFDGVSTSIVRLGLTYYGNDNLRFTAGYAYVNHYSPIEGTASQPEHRPWQQIQWFTNAKRSRVTQALRLEERYRQKMTNTGERGEGYNFNYRVRYNISLMLPMSDRPFRRGSLSLVLNDEIHINMGKQIVNNYFDQNRFFAGFALHTTKTDNLQFGYMNLFQQLPAGNRYRVIHAPRISYFHNLDLRKHRRRIFR